MKRLIKYALPVVLLAQQAGAQQLELSIEGAMAAGKAGNRNLQIEILEEQKLSANVHEAKGNLLPSVSINGTYNIFGERPVIYLRDEAVEPSVNPVRYNGRYALDASVTASYPVINTTYRSQVRIARLQKQIQQEKVRATEQDLVLGINNLYYGIVLKHSQRSQLEQSLLRNKKALADARSLFLQGKALKSDTLASFISMQNLLAAISKVENDRLRMESELKQLLGVDAAVNLLLTDSLPAEQPVTQVSSAQYSIAMEDRPDAKENRLQLQMSQEQQRRAKSIFMPQVWIAGQYQLQAQADQPAVWDKALPRSSFIGLRLAVPVYSGGKSRHARAQSLASINQQQIAIAEQQQRIQAELVTANADLNESVEQWQIQRLKVQAAEVSYNMLHERYKQGLSARLELSDAELSLTNARLNELQARYNMKMQQLYYRKAMGNLYFSKQ